MPGQPEPDEPLSRFIFSSNHFSVQKKRVKHHAFLPPPGGSTSVFRINGLANNQIQEIGHQISAQRHQPLHARGDIIARDPISLGLEVVPAEPPPRHANITGWPEDKGEAIVKAMSLASKATLVLPG
jgi:hypothetical protein